MAFGDVVQFNTGTGTTASVTVTLPGAVTAGNLLCLNFAADDYNASPPAYWNQRTGGEQQTFHGGYLWDHLVASNGEAITAYTIGSAVRSAWALVEYQGPFDASFYDIGNGTFVQSSGSNQATPSITPTSGGRLLIAGIQFQHANNDLVALSNFTNSFVEARQSLFNGGNPRLSIAQLRRVVTANGSTGYSTAADGTTAQSRSAIINAYKQGATAATGTYVKVAGVWKLSDTQVKHAGTWKQAATFVKTGGVWKAAGT